MNEASCEKKSSSWFPQKPHHHLANIGFPLDHQRHRQTKRVRRTFSTISNFAYYPLTIAPSRHWQTEFSTMKSPHLIDFPNPGCWIMHDGWKEKIHSQTTLTTHTHSRLRFFTYARSRAIFNMLSPKLDGAVGAKSASSCSARRRRGGKLVENHSLLTPRHATWKFRCSAAVRW